MWGRGRTQTFIRYVRSVSIANDRSDYYILSRGIAMPKTFTSSISPSFFVTPGCYHFPIFHLVVVNKNYHGSRHTHHTPSPFTLKQPHIHTRISFLTTDSHVRNCKSASSGCSGGNYIYATSFEKCSSSKNIPAVSMLYND